MLHTSLRLAVTPNVFDLMPSPGRRERVSVATLIEKRSEESRPVQSNMYTPSRGNQVIREHVDAVTKQRIHDDENEQRIRTWRKNTLEKVYRTPLKDQDPKQRTRKRIQQGEEIERYRVMYHSSDPTPKARCRRERMYSLMM